uniref:Transcription factor domain-containing protein n=1 Tax=Mycena chlorophos TaxID=658473 RepID=A0ABQ0M4X6_MYCCL|nr:predicted protein [Mycena chlorophos]
MNPTGRRRIHGTVWIHWRRSPPARSPPASRWGMLQLQRCDGVRPICDQCISNPPRSRQPCTYEPEASAPANQSSLDMRRTINRLRLRLEELEHSAEQLPPQSAPPGPPATSAIPEPSENVQTIMYALFFVPNHDESASTVKSRINAFLNRFADSPYFFLSAQHFAQAAPHPAGHPERPSEVLLSIVFLWASVLHHQDQDRNSDIDHYLLATLERLPAAVNHASEARLGRPRTRFLLETIQAEILLSFYYLREALPVQSRYHASAAASLSVGAGFNRLGHQQAVVTDPSFLFGPSAEPPGAGSDGASRAAFWVTVIINNVWAAAHGGPAAISRDDTETPWPGGQQSGATIQRFLNGEDSDGHSLMALIAKASTLVERVTAVTSAAPEGRLDGATYNTLHQRLQTFQAALPRPSPADANTQTLHLLTDLAVMRLQLPHVDTPGLGARQRALVAAGRIARLVQEIAATRDLIVDSILGPVASAAHSVFVAELNILRSGPQTLTPQYHTVEQRLEALVHAMTQLAVHSPSMRRCLASARARGQLEDHH